MKRRYTRELFAEKVIRIKTLMPNAFIGVDVMVGTRGETLEYFEDTLNFLTNLDISQLHVFTYSERAGTKALEIPYIVPQNDRKRRSDLLHELSTKKLNDFTTVKKEKQHCIWGSKQKNDQMSGLQKLLRVEAPYYKTMVNHSKIKI